MWTVFKLQWQRLFKQPLVVLMFLGLTVLFVNFLGGSQGDQKITTRTYSEELTSEELDEWITKLNENDTFVFEASDYDTIYERIRMNETSFALELNEENYRFLIGREDMELSPIIQHVDQVFSREKRVAQLEENDLSEPFELQTFIELNTVLSSDESNVSQGFPVGILAGMTFYFSAFSVFYLMINLIEEKKMGTWNRLIFSPLSKTKIYMGQMLHYFLVGFIQIALSFIILSNLIDVDLGTNYVPMLVVILSFIFAIVSLGMFIIGIVSSPQQLQIVIPIVATSMAMIGGAFWPLEIVNNRILLFLAELMPIKHGIQGMIGAVNQGSSVSELFGPIAALLFMGVLFMVIGLNLMERISEKSSL
ncbi:ABC transporter permease [Alkalibacterium sp. f15]|uniref:ABC transporter permease n=1 Tax=Alkalibacterium sp. f15 TaxID=3414029 RepID=UPI003BF912F7